MSSGFHDKLIGEVYLRPIKFPWDVEDPTTAGGPPPLSGEAYSLPGRGRRKGRGSVCVAGNRPLQAYLSFFGRLGWSPDARTAVGFGVGPWNGPMGTLRRSCGPAGPRFFYFSVCAGRKGAWLCQRFPFAAEGCARRRVTAGEFRLLRQATRGLCPRPPRFFEKNRVKL